MNWSLIDVNEQSVCEKYHVSALLGKVIAASQLEADRIDELLHGDMEVHTSRAECVLKCCQMILEAGRNHQKVFVGGDYDADGICATAVMKDTLDRLGIENGYYIPDRFREGYGLKPSTVEAAAKKGYSLIITVDNGVKAFDAIEKAAQLGVTMIVTDHHETDGNVNADLLVHPDLMEEEFRYYSGAGVALQISRNLLGDVPSHTALAAVAAVGDVMPLWKQTRVLVKNGLREIRNNAVPAFTAMMRPDSPADTQTVSFQIVPKLNSVGRMNDISNVNTLVPFLLSRNPDTVGAYVQQLNRVNEARKQLSTAMAKKAEDICDGSADFLLVYDESFHEGICGLVAGRLADRLHKPVIVMARNSGMIKGSGRSIEGFNMFEFFSSGFDMLQAFGGHEMAVGITVAEQDFERFSETISRKMKQTGFEYREKEEHAIRVHPDDITLDSVIDLQVLDPYPRELARPVFALEHAECFKSFSSQKVVRYHFENRDLGFDGVLFARKNIPQCEKPEIVIGTPSVNRWRNIVSVQFEIEDMR